MRKALDGPASTREARAALEAFLTRYPDSSHRDEAETLLGDINYRELFSGRPGPDKVEYIVQRGDVLDRVAHKTKSDPELIFQANSLDRIMLRSARSCEIPQVDFAVEVHLEREEARAAQPRAIFQVLRHSGRQAAAEKSAGNPHQSAGKVAYQGRPPGALSARKDYASSLRSLTLAGQPGLHDLRRAETTRADKAAGGIGLAWSRRTRRNCTRSSASARR